MLWNPLRTQGSENPKHDRGGENREKPLRETDKSIQKKSIHNFAFLKPFCTQFFFDTQKFKNENIRKMTSAKTTKDYLKMNAK